MCGPRGVNVFCFWVDGRSPYVWPSSIPKNGGSSPCRPVLNVQSRHGTQIAILGDDRTVAKGKRNRGQLHIDDRHGTAIAPEFVADSPKMLGCIVFERPFGDSGKTPNKPFAVEFPGHALFCISRSASQAASSSGVITMGSRL